MKRKNRLKHRVLYIQEDEFGQTVLFIHCLFKCKDKEYKSIECPHCSREYIRVVLSQGELFKSTFYKRTSYKCINCKRKAIYSKHLKKISDFYKIAGELGVFEYLKQLGFSIQDD